jgi:hypothetical protein
MLEISGNKQYTAGTLLRATAFFHYDADICVVGITAKKFCNSGE